MLFRSVQGNRADRDAVENLIRILDSDQAPQALAANKPKLIPVKHVDASQVAEVIRDTFRAQLGGSRTGRTPTTRTADPFAPQVAVDEATNSLIVMAASPLFEEIAQLVETLDEKAAEDPARRVKIISLEKANATRVQRALEQILRGGSRTSRGRR